MSAETSITTRLVRSARARGWAAALVGALMVVLSFPNVDLGLPIVVALVPVLVLARDRAWRGRLKLGWAFGFAYHLVIFRWIPFTVTEMTPIPLPIAWLMWLAYAAWHGLMPGVFLALAEPARRAALARAPALSVVAVALVFVVVEWLWPSIFPWSLGHALWQVGPVANIQAYLGVPGLAFFVMLLNASAAELYLRGSRRAIFVAAGTAITLLAAGWAWLAYASGAPVERTLRVAIVQPNYTLEEKKHATFDMRRKLLVRLDALVRAIPRDRYDLVVASEGSFPLHWQVHDEPGAKETAAGVATHQIGRALAEGPHADAIIGGLRADGPDLHNAAVHLAPDGHVVSFYDKRVLVPFSEYLPGTSLFPGLKDAIPGIAGFVPGTAPCHFDAADTTIGCGICYETMFADETRASAGDDADLFVNLTIDTWFGKTIAPEMHLMAHASRAVELGIPLVRAALTGISAVVSPTGAILGRMPIDTAGVLPVDVPLQRLRTPYRAVGPLFVWLCGGLVLLLLLDALRRHRELSRRPVVQPAQDA